MPDPITDKDALLPPLSFRRGLVFGTGFSLLLLSIITVRNMWLYFDNNTTNINEFLLLIFSSWGISYVTFLWLSFFVIVIKKLPSCAWTGIKKGLLKSGDVHICVDSVLNVRQDVEQKKSGISVELLETEGSRLWIIGLIALLILAYVLTLDIIPIYLRLIMLGVISSLYYLYDITVHEFSKNRRSLDGVGDYGELLRMYLRWSSKDS